jgi:hypothetical protein
VTTLDIDDVVTLTNELEGRLSIDGKVTRSSAPALAANDIRVDSLEFEASTITHLYFEETVSEHRHRTETLKDKAYHDLLAKLSPRAEQEWLSVHLGQSNTDKGVFDPVEKDFKETCATCSGNGRNQCSVCSGAGECTCTACTYGKTDCGACYGRGVRRCDGCYGSGNIRRRFHVRNEPRPNGGWDEVWEERNVICSACGGVGWAGTCYHCRGSGEVNCRICQGTARLQCITCHGSGSLSCIPCKASGERYFTLTMVPRVRETRVFNCPSAPDAFKKLQELDGYLDQPAAKRWQHLTWEQSGARGEYRYRGRAHAASAWLEDKQVVALGNHEKRRWISDAYRETLLLPIAEDIGARSFAELNSYPLGREVLSIVQGNKQPQSMLATYDPHGFLNDGIAQLKTEVTNKLTRGEKWHVAILLVLTLFGTLFSFSLPAGSYVSTFGVNTDTLWFALVAWMPWLAWIGLIILRRATRQRRSQRLFGKPVKTGSKIGVISAVLLVIVQVIGFGLQQTSTISAQARYVCDERIVEAGPCVVQSAAIHFILAPYFLWQGQDIPFGEELRNWQAR